MNIFIHESEGRLRAGWRLLMQFVVAAIAGISLWYPISWLGLGVEATGVLTNGVAIILSIAIIGRFVDRRKFTDFGLQTADGWKRELWLGTALGIAAMTGIWLVQWILGYITFDGFGWERPSQSFWLMPIVGYMMLMIAVGFYEEYWTRGYQLKVLAEGMHVGALSPRVAVGISMALTSVFFGILHAGNPNASTISIVNISFAGIMLALPYVLTGRLWVSIGLHFSWNFFQGAIFGFPVSGRQFRTSVIQSAQGGPDWFTGGAFGPEAGAVGLLAMVIMCVWMYVKFRPESLDANITEIVAPPRDM
jgi:uncharacterized protein